MDVTKIPLPKDYQELLTTFFYVISEYGETVDSSLLISLEGSSSDDSYVKIDKQELIQFAQDYIDHKVVVEMVDDPTTGDRWYRVRKRTDDFMWIKND